MKKLIALFTIVLSTTTMAANPYSTDTAVVFDHYKNVIQQTPYRVEVCQDRVQHSGDGSATNELVGALFGGAIGNSLGKGDGKDAMTLFGALMGASLAHDDQIAKGPTRTVSVCDIETRYEESMSKAYSHSTISFTAKGNQYKIDFIK